jgi:Zn-dependent peptidase ImmA (M78 family)
VPSLEGLYLNEEEAIRICVCAHRPSGRQRFTAAHEFGHHVLGHGSRIDAGFDLENSVPSAIEEKSADVFARYLLMPRRAVDRAFYLRGLNASSPDPYDIYRVAAWLGVGYETLVHQMAATLGLIDGSVATALKKCRVADLKRFAATVPTKNDVWMLDKLWAGRTVHVQIGDIIRGIGPSQEVPNVLTQCGEDVFVAERSGEAVYALHSNEPVRICVSRRSFVGFYEYRYLPE